MLPKNFVERHLLKAKGATIFGVPLEELTRDELLAVAVAGWEIYTSYLTEAIEKGQRLRQRMIKMGEENYARRSEEG
jgi:dissimilatory sulfite reductase (desulfoviridin) alpha/beta subunit